MARVPSATPLEVVRAYFRAHNSHDVNGALALLSHRIVFEAVGTWTRKGVALARELEEWDASLGSTLEPYGMVADGEVVTCQVREQNEWFALTRAGEVTWARCEFRVSQGRIMSITSELEEESQARIDQALQAVLAWAGDNRATELSRLIPGGRFHYNAEAATCWIALLQEWRATLS